ncbi:hypothetical protein B0A48_15199 [Cryoendolithus antarcticus]|uniref:Uncharacterized protein n=1 Tax=Cryoendolithus antarcticus TaxID=1507870 RepID=A0A1V8SIE1_9PEZI|nr:hypothetical protein B0A48_15199 [Cryoendolithus antarcticus]
MSVPRPKQALDGHCSAVHDDTLYVYSSTGFQSLRLKENATWSEETAGTLVTGPACVTAVPGDDSSKAVMYVVGGTTDDSNYSGLQRYSFAEKTWETLPLLADNMQGRTNHSAAYLEDSQSIVVYAGSTPDAPSWLSSQTFLLQTSEPHNVQSFVSTAAPANQPILQSWNSSHAIMAGGSLLSNVVYTFEPSAGWQQLGTNLSQPMAPGIRGAIVSGSDGSKVLETYDATASPNTVSQIVLLGAFGATAQTGTIVGASQSRKRRRDLTLENWPAYNGTDAPTTTRSDYSVAQGSDGKVVLAGGDSDSPVALYDQTGNTWIDAGKFFNGDIQQPIQPSTTSGASPSSTSSAPSATSSTAAASAGGLSSHDRMLRTLGIVLGVLCGIAALFIIALLLVRRQKIKKQRNSGYVEKTERQGDRMSFADRGASFMKEAGGSIANITPPPRNRYESPAAGSHSSLAIIAGKFGNKRNTPNHAAKGSMESTANLVRDKNGTTIGNEPMEMLDVGDKKYLTVEHQPRHKQPAPPMLQVQGASPEEGSALRDRSSGWSRYFSTSQPNDLTHMPSAYTKDRQSDGSNWPSTGHPSEMSRIPSSAFVPPLDIDFSKTIDGQRLSNVVSASPAFSDSREDLARRGSTVEGQQGRIESDDRPLSSTTTISSYDRSTMSSDYYNGLSSGNTPWTPVSNSFKDHVNAAAGASRPPSSNYTASVYEQRVPSRGARAKNAGFFPGSGTNYKPPAKLKLSHNASPSADWAAPAGATKDSPLLKSPPPVTAPAPVHDRDSTATVFPRQANDDRWTTNAPAPLAPPRPLQSHHPDQNDRASTLTVFPQPSPHDRDAWTANTPSGLKPPNAMGLQQRDSGNAFQNAAKAAEDRDSTLTVFPRGVPSAYYAGRTKEVDEGERKKAPMGSDLGWLNLGLGGSRT